MLAPFVGTGKTIIGIQSLSELKQTMHIDFAGQRLLVSPTEETPIGTYFAIVLTKTDGTLSKNKVITIKVLPAGTEPPTDTETETDSSTDPDSSDPETPIDEDEEK